MASILPPYHITMVVDDVPAAMADMTRTLGMQWAPVQYGDLFTYSLQGPPYIELLKRRDGTIFDTVGLHHIGVWVDDMDAEQRRLTALGCEPELVERDTDGNIKPGCFVKTRDGLRLELVQIGSSGPKLARLLNGESYS